MKKFILILTSLLTFLIIWTCTDLEHSNPFDPDWGDVTALNNVTLEVQKIDRIKVIWDSDYFNKDGYTFQVDRKLGDGNWQEKFKVFNKDMNNFTDSIAGINQTNYYRVRVGFDQNLSDPIEASIINSFQAPSNLYYTKLNISSIKLNWDDNSNGEAGFRIDRKIDDNDWVTGYATTNENVLTWTDDGAVINSEIEYRISGIKNGVSSDSIVTHSINNEFPPPTNLMLESAGVNQLSLTWNDNSIGEDGFKINKKNESGIWNVVATVGSNLTEWTDTNAVTNDSLSYRIHAYKSTYVSYFSECSINQLLYPPPSNLIYNKLNISTIELNWTDNSTGEDGFKIDKNIGDSDWIIEYGSVNRNITTWTDVSAEINENLTYRVYMHTGIINSSFLTSVIIDNSIPAPTNLKGNSLGTDVTLTWTDNSIGEDGFKIDRKIGDGAWVENYAVVDSNIVSFNETLPDTGKYYYKVKAYFSIFMSISNDMIEINTNKITFMKTFGGSEHDEGYSAQQTTDGGYIILGDSQTTYETKTTDAWLIKTDLSGNVEWNKKYGGFSEDRGRSVQQTMDGGFIIVGYTESFGAGIFDVWLFKTDENGNQEWDKTFGGTQYDMGYSVHQTSDSGYIITGRTNSSGAGSEDVLLIKTDASGNQTWIKTFGGIGNERGYSVHQSADGGYIITGLTHSAGAGYSDVWLIKTDNNGIEEWNKTFGGVGYDEGYSVQQTTDGGYIITGFTSATNNYEITDLWLIKTDNNGVEEWNKIFSGTKPDYGWSVQQTADGGYIITGIHSGTTGWDLWLIKTDNNGV
ncbi:MAG: hypothetical protein L6407_09160, partial [Candidatus Delongbacteria bacterium]|nr:hypothetical protein [Candidatus Delongbacteria bacterium]